MTKEEQRFTAAVAAMQAIIQKGPIHRLYADMPTLISESVEHTIEESVLYADALIKELYKEENIVSVVKIKRLCEDNICEDNTYDCHNCNFDDINSIEDCCPKCGSKIEWVIEENEPLPSYKKDLFANSKNLVLSTITEIDFKSKNSNSKTTPDPITEPSMNSIGDIKLRK